MEFSLLKDLVMLFGLALVTVVLFRQIGRASCRERV